MVVLPYLRPMATITQDTLGWYGWMKGAPGARRHRHAGRSYTMGCSRAQIITTAATRI